MGFVNKLRNELIDIVEWVDDSQHTLVWRFPRYHNQIKNGAKLIVRPGQSAIFVNEGKVADVFGPGSHTLETRNLPVLSTLQGWKHGFDSSFRSEVYFVVTKQVTDLKWGTPNPIILRDADFGPVRLRAFGTYTLKAHDPRILLEELVGTDSEFEAEEISVLLRSIINTAFADLIATSKISILDLASNYEDLSLKLRDLVQEKIDDEYGLLLPQLFIVNFSLPAEVEKALDARSSMGILGDLTTYQQYQIGAATPDLATNPAGGIAGAGLGMGMGMSMMNQFPMGGNSGPGGAPFGGHAAGPVVGPTAPMGPTGSVPGGGIPGMPLAPPAMNVVPQAPPASQVGWHVTRDGQQFGPYTSTRVLELIQTGSVIGNTLVWAQGLAGWTEVGQIPAFAPYFQAPPPPPPPAR